MGRSKCRCKLKSGSSQLWVCCACDNWVHVSRDQCNACLHKRGDAPPVEHGEGAPGA